MTYIFPGLVIGAVYAIFGNSITLAYSATGVLNLATGAMAYFSADFFYTLVTGHNWPLLWAGLLCVIVVGPGLGLVLWAAVFRRMEESDFVIQVVATIGISVAIPGLADLIFNHQSVEQAPGIIPGGLLLVHFWFITATRNQLGAVIGALICVVGLVLLIDRTRLGLQTRAVVDRPLMAQTRGINTQMVSALSWALAGLLIGIGGILLSPLINLDSGTYTALTVAALSVALVGRFRSLIITSISGLVLGVATSLLIGYAPQGSTLLQGLAPSLPFFLLTALLLLGWSPRSARRDAVEAQGARRLTRGMPETSTGHGGDDPDVAPAPILHATHGSGAVLSLAPTALKLAALVGLLMIGMFLFSDYWTGIIGVGLAYSVIFLSFTVATGEGSVLCLGQAAFVAIGGFLAGRFVAADGLPLLASAVVAVVAAVLVGIVIGAIGSRLDQIGFTLVTLAFALFCQQFAFNIGVFVPPAGVPYPVVKLFGLTQSRSNVLLGFVIFVIIAGIVGYLKRGRLGRAYASLRGNPISSESLGIDVRSLRTAVFAVAGGIAGLGGVLLGIDEQQLGAPDVALAVGLVWVAVNVAFGVRGSQGAFLAGLAYSLIPAGLSFVPGTWPGKVSPVLFGLGAVGLAKEPRGFLAPLQEKLSNRVRRRRPVMRVSAQIP